MQFLELFKATLRNIERIWWLGEGQVFSAGLCNVACTALRRLSMLVLHSLISDAFILAMCYRLSRSSFISLPIMSEWRSCFRSILITTFLCIFCLTRLLLHTIFLHFHFIVLCSSGKYFWKMTKYCRNKRVPLSSFFTLTDTDSWLCFVAWSLLWSSDFLHYLLIGKMGVILKIYNSFLGVRKLGIKKKTPQYS